MSSAQHSNRELEEQELEQRQSPKGCEIPVEDQNKFTTMDNVVVGSDSNNDDNHYDNRIEEVIKERDATILQLSNQVENLEKIDFDENNRDAGIHLKKKKRAGNDDDDENAATATSTIDIPPQEEQQQQSKGLPFNYNSFLQRVFLLMFIGLLITAFVSFLCQLYKVDVFLTEHNGLLIGLLIFEIILVFYLMFAFSKMSYHTASGVFFFYAFLNGITITPIISLYTVASVALAFVCTSSIFLSMSAIGYFTKRDLSSWGPILFSCLIGLIIASVVNWFLQSSQMQFIICIIGVLLFSALTAYDVNIIKQLGEKMGNKSETEDMMKLAVFGALQLYLDFLNLFLYILQLLGKSRG